jgi:hypothetical protein
MPNIVGPAFHLADRHRIGTCLLKKKKHISFNICGPTSVLVLCERHSVHSVDDVLTQTTKTVEILAKDLVFDQMLALGRTVDVTPPIARSVKLGIPTAAPFSRNFLVPQP